MLSSSETQLGSNLMLSLIWRSKIAMTALVMIRRKLGTILFVQASVYRPVPNGSIKGNTSQ